MNNRQQSIPLPLPWDSMLLVAVIIQISSNFWTYGELQPPKIGTRILSEKLNRTQMYDVKIKEFMKIFENSTAGIKEQRDRAKAFIAAMSNAKVKQATQKIFDELQNAQDFAWLVLNRTDDELRPILGEAMPQVQELIDRTCFDLNGNYTACLPAAMRNVASQMVPFVGKNKTKVAFDSLLQWENGQRAGLERMRKFFSSV